MLDESISTYDKVMICQLHEDLKASIPQYADMDGSKNIWVVKPSFNSRGVGIYLSNKLRDIIQVGKKS